MKILKHSQTAGRSLLWAFVIMTVLITGCQSSQHNTDQLTADSNESELFLDNGDFDLLEEEFAEKKIKIADPLKPLNRIMYHFNDAVYIWVLDPGTKLYTKIAPEPVRLGISNFFRNITTPIRFVNCHLQAKHKTADKELGRFLINTTLGVLGFGDPAKDRYNLQIPEAEDLGQTLATYGLSNGFYVVWPILGPSTARDSVGRVGDMFLNPVYYLDDTYASLGISGLRFVNKNSFHLDEYKAFKESSIDPYIAMREMYIQYRNKQVQN
ncbi:MAG: MlaA family lipoprotein [Planctomycetota bacterium]|jgi:phospholipid-binding lipoprotein MlaA